MAQPVLAAITGFVAAALIAGLGIHALRGAAVRHGLVDNPGGRKLHCRPTPVVGGIGIAVALLAVGPLVFGQVDADLSRASVWLAATASLGAFLLVLVAGLIDDQRGIGSTRKFVVQGLAAALLIAGAGLELERIGQWPTGAAIELGALSIPVTVIAVVGFVNAFNMIDGVDGLAGSTAVIMLAAIAYAGWRVDAAVITLLAVILAGACVGFLAHNLRTPWRSRAAAFMGDAGSLVVGLIIVATAIDVSQRQSTTVSAVAVAWVVALPVIATLSLMIRRLLRGQSPFHADCNHLHHILGRAGFTPGQIAMIIAGVTLVMAVIGIAGSRIGVPDLLLGIALVLVAAAHYIFVRYAWRTTKALRRLRQWLVISDPHRLPVADGLALGGFYAVAVAIPAGIHELAGLGAMLIMLGSIGQRRAIRDDLRGLAMARMALLMAGWMTLAVFLRPTPTVAVWLPMIVLTGVLALPVGWWLRRFWHHAAALFGLALVTLIVAWAAAADWQMLEAGHVRTTDHWGRVETGGLLLVLMITSLVGAVAYGIADYARRWRARVALATGMIGIAALLLLLLGLSLRSAVAAGLIGLVAMTLAALRSVEPSRFRLGVGVAAVATALLGSVIGNTFKPPDVSLNDQYWGPVQSAFLYAGGSVETAQARYPAVAARVADWREVVEQTRARPFAGYGRASVGAANAEPMPAERSAYAALLLTGGVPALALFAGVLGAWYRATHHAARRAIASPAETVVAEGMLGVILGALLLGPTVDHLLSAMMVTGVLALGVRSSLNLRAADQAMAQSAFDASDGTPPLRIVHRSADRR